MVDKALFIDSSAARDSMHQLEILSNNLANIGTTGFRADHEMYKSIPVDSNDNQSRVYSSIDKTFSDFQVGPITNTGRDLDVALPDIGFIAVQSKTGQEAYTRAGDLQVKNGFLTIRTGELVKGSSGVIKIPPQSTRLTISPDGTISAQIPGQTDLTTVDQIKLANPSLAQIQKGKDGLFYLPDGDTARPDHNIKLTPGALEGSNVNTVKTLTDLIDLSRRFEFHTNLMKNFSDNAAKANQILNVT